MTNTDMTAPRNLPKLELITGSSLNPELSEEEKAFIVAVELQCMLSISKYLLELAETMKANSIESINADSIKIMAETMLERAAQPSQQN
jgi:hypothetical protein